MDAKDFRRIALSMPGAEQASHMGAVDFRVGGRIFATLASIKQGYGNLMLDPERQQAFVGELPEIFLPVAGGWGRGGATHVRLAVVTEDVLTGALRTAWQLRVALNARSGNKALRKKPSSEEVSTAAPQKARKTEKPSRLSKPAKKRR